MNLIFLLLPYFTIMDWPATPQQIDALVVQLGNPKYKERQKADVYLRHVGSSAVLSLEKAKKHKDLEIARRAESILDDYWNSYYTILNGIPMIHLYLPQNYHLHYYRKSMYINKSTIDYRGECWTAATKLFVKDLVEHGVPKSVIISQLHYAGIQHKGHYSYKDQEGNDQGYDYCNIEKSIHPDLQPYLDKKEFKEHYEREDKKINEWFLKQTGQR